MCAQLQHEREMLVRTRLDIELEIQAACVLLVPVCCIGRYARRPFVHGFSEDESTVVDTRALFGSIRMLSTLTKLMEAQVTLLRRAPLLSFALRSASLTCTHS